MLRPVPSERELGRSPSSWPALKVLTVGGGVPPRRVCSQLDRVRRRVARPDVGHDSPRNLRLPVGTGSRWEGGGNRRQPRLRRLQAKVLHALRLRGNDASDRPHHLSRTCAIGFVPASRPAADPARVPACGRAAALRLPTLVRTPGDPPSERGSDPAAPFPRTGEANHIRHHQPQEPTVRESGAGPIRYDADVSPPSPSTITERGTEDNVRTPSESRAGGSYWPLRGTRR